MRTFSLVFWPRTKMAVFSFSIACGSRFSSARLTRAFLGLLVKADQRLARFWGKATHIVLSIDMMDDC